MLYLYQKQGNTKIKKRGKIKMTKKQQLKKEVTEAWDFLNIAESEWGKDSVEYLRARAKWFAFDKAWNIMC